MLRNSKLAKMTLAAVPSLFLLGCATPQDVDALRNDIAALKTDVQRALRGIDDVRAAQTAQGQRLDQVNTAVQRAQASADAAAAAARAADEKADRVFRRSLRK